MNIFYADDTYAKDDKEMSLPRTNLFGGVLLAKEDEAILLNIIKEEKSKFTHPNLPIKWNFKDTLVKEKFERFNREEEYKKMLAASNTWRREIIKRSVEIEYKIVCGIIQNYSRDTKIVKKSKPDLLKYSFENVLMRLGIDALEHTTETLVLLDWPPDGNPQPFIEAFYRLYHQGKSSAGTVIKSGKLSDCRFFHTLLFAKCTHSPVLQFTDLVVGALKDYLERKITGRQNLFAQEMYEILKPKIRQIKGKILGYGIIPPTGNSVFRSTLKQIFS